jgi:hypothetical protein
MARPLARSRHGPKGLRLGARSDRPPMPGFTGIGSLRRTDPGHTGLLVARYRPDQARILQSGFVQVSPPTLQVRRDFLACPGSDSVRFEAACGERATAGPRDKAFEVKCPHRFAPCDVLDLSQRCMRAARRRPRSWNLCRARPKPDCLRGYRQCGTTTRRPVRPGISKPTRCKRAVAQRNSRRRMA